MLRENNAGSVMEIKAQASANSTQEGGFDCLTHFGRHAFRADDELWTEAQYVEDMVIVVAGYAPYTALKDVPLSFKKLFSQLYGRRVDIIVLTTTASDANMFYLTLATEKVRARKKKSKARKMKEGQVLICDGCYVAGRGVMRSRSGTARLADTAYHAALKQYIVPAPWGYEYENELSTGIFADDLTVFEQKCLTCVSKTFHQLEADGIFIGVLLVELIRVDNAQGLRRAYVRALRNLTTRLCIHFCIDDAMMSIRCGAPLSYQLYGEDCAPDYVTIGKHYLVAGVLRIAAKRTNTSAYSSITAVAEGGLIAKSSAILRAVIKRNLVKSCLNCGLLLKMKLRDAGFDVHGCGLFLYCASTNGLTGAFGSGIRMSFGRLIPHLTIDSSMIVKLRINRNSSNCDAATLGASKRDDRLRKRKGFLTSSRSRKK